MKPQGLRDEVRQNTDQSARLQIAANDKGRQNGQTKPAKGRHTHGIAIVDGNLTVHTNGQWLAITVDELPFLRGGNIAIQNKGMRPQILRHKRRAAFFEIGWTCTDSQTDRRKATGDQTRILQSRNADGNVVTFIHQINETVAHRHIQFHIRVERAKIRQCLRQMQKAETHRRIDAQSATRRRLQLRDGEIGFCEISQNLPDTSEIALPGFGQRERTRGAVDETRAKLGFQSRDLSADDGFGRTQTPRRLRKRAGFSNLHKGFDGGETIHCCYFYNNKFRKSMIVSFYRQAYVWPIDTFMEALMSLATDTQAKPFLPALAPLTGAAAPLGLPLIRIATGLLLVPHGAQKLFGAFGGYGLEATGQFFATKLGLPASFALLAGLIEVFGGLLLAAGFLTRPVAALVAGMMAVATFGVHWGNGFFWTSGGFEYPLFWGLAALGFVLNGGGRYSVDAWLGREF